MISNILWNFPFFRSSMVDPVLVIGAIVAALGIAAFGFLYFVSNDESNSYDAGSRQKLLGIKPKNPNKKPKEGKQEKKNKKASKPKKDSSAKGKYRREMKNRKYRMLNSKPCMDQIGQNISRNSGRTTL